PMSYTLSLHGALPICKALISSGTTEPASTWHLSANCLAPFNGCTGPAISKGPASGWQPCNGSCNATAAKSGLKERSTKGPVFILDRKSTSLNSSHQII